MSLTTEDIQQIRVIVREEARVIVREELESSITTRIEPRFDGLDRRIEALDNDIKEIYAMISELQYLTVKLLILKNTIWSKKSFHHTKISYRLQKKLA